MLKRGDDCNAYLIHACRQPQIVERSEWEHTKQELLANTVAFISCRSRLTIILVGAAKGEKGNGGGGGQVKLPDVNTEKLSDLKYELVCHFKLTAHMDGVVSGSL
jgi:hypothetical protein